MTGFVAAAIVLLKAYSRSMSRTILTVLGVLLAIWLLFMVIGLAAAALKFLIWIGFLAIIAAVVITALGRLTKSR